MKTNSLERKILLVLLVVGILLSVFFGLRAMRSFARLHQSGLHPGETDVSAIRGWMTVPYIAKVYRVPSDYLYQQIGIPRAGNDAKSLGDLNKEYFFGQPGAVMQKVKDAIARYKPPTTDIPPGPGL